MKSALAEVLGRVGRGRAEFVTADDAEAWPPGALAAIESAGVLARTDNGTSLRCDGCEDRCLVTPEWRRPRNRPPSLVHACHRPREIGLVVLDPERLRRWRVHMAGFARWLATGLHLVGAVEERVGAPWRLGERTVEGARRSVFLALGDTDRRTLAAPNPVVLAVEGVRVDAPHTIPVLALIQAVDGVLAVDAAAFAAALAPARKARAIVEPLPVPKGLRWDQVILRVLDEELVEVVLGREPPRRCAPAELGMVDGRNGQPTEAWRLLLDLAEAGGNLDWGSKGADAKRKARIGALRRALEAAIPAEGEAIPDYRKGGKGWTPTFRITDRRGT